MKRSKIVLPVHLVWSTKHRQPWIHSELEPHLHRALVAEALAQKAQILAIGGMPDHVHLAVLLPATVSLALFVKQLKGMSSRLVTTQLLPQEGFCWQEGYGAFAFQVELTDRVVAYIQQQKQHHAQHEGLWHALEETEVDVPGRVQ